MLGEDTQYGCDYYSIMYESYTYGGFFKGWSDVIMARGTYLVSLENIGDIVEAAYQTLANPDVFIVVNETTPNLSIDWPDIDNSTTESSVTAWENVQLTYNETLTQITK